MLTSATDTSSVFEVCNELLCCITSCVLVSLELELELNILARARLYSSFLSSTLFKLLFFEELEFSPPLTCDRLLGRCLIATLTTLLLRLSSVGMLTGMSAKRINGSRNSEVLRTMIREAEPSGRLLSNKTMDWSE
ncbi:hypothetical protein HanIR_Chr14g0717011 [Helianthus annuus]|nr:hypothetical protein HanIR_Chr14g0717011 [Helianthus annuus]